MLTVLSLDLPATASQEERSVAFVSHGTGVVTHDVVTDGGEVVTNAVYGCVGKLSVRIRHTKRRECPVRPPAPACKGEAGRRYLSHVAGVLATATEDTPPTLVLSKPTAIECRSYAVKLDELRPGESGHAFMVEHLDPVTDRDPDENTGPYRVLVGGAVEDCTCTADHCKAPVCRHKDALRALLAVPAFLDCLAWHGEDCREVPEHEYDRAFPRAGHDAGDPDDDGPDTDVFVPTGDDVEDVLPEVFRGATGWGKLLGPWD